MLYEKSDGVGRAWHPKGSAGHPTHRASPGTLPVEGREGGNRSGRSTGISKDENAMPSRTKAAAASDHSSPSTGEVARRAGRGREAAIG